MDEFVDFFMCHGATFPSHCSNGGCILQYNRLVTFQLDGFELSHYTTDNVFLLAGDDVLDLSFHIQKDIDPIALLALALTLMQAGISILRWWRSRIEIVIRSHANIVMVGGIPDGKKFVSIRVTNRGITPFYLRGIYASVWASRLSKLLKRKPVNLYLRVIDGRTGIENAPADVAVGSEWLGFIEQTDQINEMRKGYFRVEASCSKYDKHVTCRLR
ncbi:MAG: hypothetical protein SFW64_03670 [Alphaproteobacteria bacterium]|nr:hypothetical protein [Alphaproteobacteria bacterium]